MIAHVLVPLDGSLLARSALDYALKLIDSSGTITLLTILQPPEVPIYDFYPVTMSPQKDYEAGFTEALTHAQDYLYQITNEIQEKYAINIEATVEMGDPATAIIEAAAKLGTDAIVMSTHGRSGISRWLFGSVTQKVLAASCCPVFVIPPQVVEERKTSEQKVVETESV